MWKVRGVSVSGLLVHVWVFKYVNEMNMKPYVPWPLVVGGQVQGSRVYIQEEGCCTTGLVKWYREGEWLVGIEGSGSSAYCLGMSFPFW